MATGVTRKKSDLEALLAPAWEPNALPSKATIHNLQYESKLDEPTVLQPSPNAVLAPIGSTTGDLKPNTLILADNLLAMNALLREFRGQVGLIYMDPPYGTGQSFFSRGQTHAYYDEAFSARSLEFMRRRFVLMRELLADNGSIYVHIGHQMLFHLKVVMDEVFGAQNFQNLIVRRKCSSKNFTSRRFANLNDYILFYSKTKTYTWNQPGVLPPKEWIDKEYPKRDGRGRYKLVPIHAPGTRNGSTGQEWRGMMPPPGKHWQYTPSRLEELAAAGEIYWSRNGNPRRKVYWTENKLLPLTDYWDRFRDAHHQSVKVSGYPTEKNLDMLKTIVASSSRPGDIVLDPFCGSGTTLDAAEMLGRKWIGLDNSVAAIQTSIKRLKNGTAPLGDYVGKSVKRPSSQMRGVNFNLFADASIAEIVRDALAAN